MQNREYHIDAIRGGAIILVVIGHLIQYNQTNYLNNTIFNCIYSFHMPLFFFISGYVYELSKKNLSLITIRCLGISILNRLISLILPSIIWSFIINTLFSLETTIQHSLSGYWFLNTLFAITVLWDLYCYLSNKIKINTYGSIILWGLAIGVVMILGIKRVVAMYFALFVLGFYCSQFKICKLVTSKLILLSIVAFIAGMLSFQYTETDSRVLIELPTSIAASISLFWLFEKADRERIWFKFMAQCGRFSIGIYLVHFIFLAALPIRYNSQIIQGTLIAVYTIIIISACMLLQIVCSKSSFLNALLFGKYRIPNE